jgi:hypothetical protein
VGLVARFIIGQAAMSGLIGLAYNRRNAPWLVVMVLLAVSLFLLAAFVRSGTHAAWATALAGEAMLAVIGLYRFVFFGRYIGGTLLALAVFGVLIHPAVGRAFAAPPRRGRLQVAEAPFDAAPFDAAGEPTGSFGQGAAS